MSNHERTDATVRLNLEVAPATKEEIRKEAERAGLNMTQLLLAAWRTYKLIRDERLYIKEKHAAGGTEYIRLRILS